MSITDIISSAYRSVMLLVTLLLSVVLLVVAYSDLANPESWTWVPYLGLFMGPVLLVCILWLLVLLVLGRWWCVLVMLFTMFLSGKDIVNYCPVSFRSNDAVGDTLRILTFNTRAMGDQQLRDAKTKLPVVEFVRQSGADVVCLQEYAFSFSKEGHTEAQLRKYMSDIYPYYCFTPNSGRKALGIAMYSKFPIKNTVVLPNPHKNRSFALMADLDVRGRDVKVVTMHLCSNQIQPKDRELYDRMLTNFNSDSLQVLGEGISTYMGHAYKKRAAEVHEIQDVLSDKPADTPLIICGDMNDTPASYAYRVLRGSLNDAWCDSGMGPGFTFFHHNLLVRIDHIFYSDHFTVQDVDIHSEIKDSDHYPVSATLIF